MAILGISFVAADLKELMIRESTKVHEMCYEIKNIVKMMSQISDADLEAIYQTGGSSDPVADRAAFRSWLTAIDGYADNYSGNGILTDKSFEIAKRVKLPL